MKNKFILTVILSLLLFSVVSANISEIEIDFPDLNVILTDNFLLPIQVTNLAGLGVISYEIIIDYDDSYLDYQGIETANTLSSLGIVNSSIINGDIKIVGIFTQPLSGEGKLLNLKFQALSSGLTEVDFVSSIFNTTSVENFSKGEINIIDAPADAELFVGDYSGIPGSDFQINLQADSIANSNCISFEFDFVFDQNILSYIGFENSNTLTENWSINANTDSSSVSIAGINTDPISQNGVFLRLNFHIDSTATNGCDLLLENVILNTIDDITVIQGSLEILTGLYAPQNVLLEPYNDSLRLSWEEVPTAESYKVYKSNEYTGTYNLIQSGSFSQTGDRIYWNFNPEVNTGFYYIKSCSNE